MFHFIPKSILLANSNCLAILFRIASSLISVDSSSYFFVYFQLFHLKANLNVLILVTLHVHKHYHVISVPCTKRVRGNDIYR